MELLCPAPSPEGARAAVQNGADAVYLSFAALGGCREAPNFSDAAFESGVAACKSRGCKVYLSMDVLLNDAELQKAGGLCLRAQRAGVDAILLRDMGLFRVLRRLLPDMPLFASAALGFRTAEDMRMAAALGFRRVFLPPELDRALIAPLSGQGVELAYMGQGALCAAERGQCSLSRLNGRGSADRGSCANNCRESFSLGGRWDTTPLSYKDRCLLQQVDELEKSGVDCLYIGDIHRRAEYVAAMTQLYDKAIHEGKQSAAPDVEKAEEIFSEYGFSPDMEPAGEAESAAGKDIEAHCSTLRRSYSEQSEVRRIDVQFAIAVRGEHRNIRIGVIDEEGHQAIIDGPLPVCFGDVPLEDESVREILYKTAGTPYHCTAVRVRDGEGLSVAAVELETARRELLRLLTEERSRPGERTEGSFPKEPDNSAVYEEPTVSFRFRSMEQMDPKLAELGATLIYVPLEAAVKDPVPLSPFRNKGITIVGVLPPVVVGEEEQRELDTLLEKAKKLGIRELCAPSLALAMKGRSAGFDVRAGAEMNVFNSYALQNLSTWGFLSATVSDQLSLGQVRALRKSLNCEFVIYGRETAMVTNGCLIKASAGRCACGTPAQMADTRGGVWPVIREFGCRNVVFSSKKLFLADKAAEFLSCGAWSVQLSFTTESARECLSVARSYLENSGYRPNGLSRGERYKGVK